MRSGGLRRTQRHHFGLGIGRAVQSCLLAAAIELSRLDAETQALVEDDAALDVRHADRRMAHAQRRSSPPARGIALAWRTLTRWKLDQFQCMSVEVAKLEGVHATRCGRRLLRAATADGHRREAW